MRAQKGAARRKSNKRLMKLVRGQYGGRSKLLVMARESEKRMMQYAFRDRRDRKRQFRKLWILRINAATRMRGMTYSRFVSGLAKAGIAADRKTLAHLAVSDPTTFGKLVETARAAIAV